jgi:hypothetical protein
MHYSIKVDNSQKYYNALSFKWLLLLLPPPKLFSRYILTLDLAASAYVVKISFITLLSGIFLWKEFFIISVDVSV